MRTSWLVRTYDSVQSLITCATEVEVMGQTMFAAAINGMEYDLHVEFSPSFLLEVEGWFLQCWKSEEGGLADPTMLMEKSPLALYIL